MLLRRIFILLCILTGGLLVHFSPQLSDALARNWLPHAHYQFDYFAWRFLDDSTPDPIRNEPIDGRFNHHFVYVTDLSVLGTHPLRQRIQTMIDGLLSSYPDHKNEVFICQFYFRGNGRLCDVEVHPEGLEYPAKTSEKLTTHEIRTLLVQFTKHIREPAHPSRFYIILQSLFGIAFLGTALGFYFSHNIEAQFATQERISRDESEADALLASLRATYAPEKSKPKPESQDEEKREELEREMASLRRVQKQIPIEHPDERKGDALLQTQQNIDDIQTELDELSPANEQTSETTEVGPLSERALLDEAINRCPNNAALYAKRAWVLHTQGDHDQALADAERALQLIPNYPAVLNTLGAVYQHKGDDVRAVDYYRRAFRANPRHTAPRTNLARLYNSQGKYRDAVTVAEKAIKIDPAYSAAHVELAKAHAKLGDHKAAISHFTTAIEADPKKYAHLLHERAEQYHQLGQAELALRDLKTIVANGNATRSTYDLLIELEPKEPKHYCRRANDRWRYSDYRGEADDLRRAIDLYRDRAPGPDFVKCLTAMVKVQNWLVGKDDCALPAKETIALGREAFKMAEEMEEAGLAMEILAGTKVFASRAEEHDEAVSLSLKLVAMTTHPAFPDSLDIPTVHVVHIRTLAESGRIDQAVQAAFHTIAVCPDYGQRFLYDIFKIIGVNKEKDKEHAVALLNDVHDRLINDWSNNTKDSLACAWAHYYLSKCHASWQDTSFYDLEKAKHHAKQARITAQACQLSDLDDFTSLLWAVCELIEPGSGRAELEKHYPDPIAYCEIEQKGRELLQEFQPTSA